MASSWMERLRQSPPIILIYILLLIKNILLLRFTKKNAKKLAYVKKKLYLCSGFKMRSFKFFEVVHKYVFNILAIMFCSHMKTAAKLVKNF